MVGIGSELVVLKPKAEARVALSGCAGHRGFLLHRAGIWLRGWGWACGNEYVLMANASRYLGATEWAKAIARAFPAAAMASW